MLLQRNALQNLKSWKSSKDRQPLVVSGARQVGKTSLVRTFGVSEFRRMHEFNFEEVRSIHKIFTGDLDPQRIVRELSLAKDDAIDTDNDLVFFDEIQSCPSALNSLKYFSERMPQLALVGAGSLLGLHLSDKSFPVGKVDRLTIYPLSFDEFVRAVTGSTVINEWGISKHTRKVSDTLHDKLWSCFLDFLIVGGLPAAVVDFKSHLKSPIHAKEAYDAARRRHQLLATDYVADIAKHSGKINAHHIQSVWDSIPLQLSRVFDQSTQRFKFKDVIPGRSAYRDLAGPIDWLTKAGLAIRVPICQKAELPLAAFTTLNMFKLYLFDTGLLGALLDLKPATIRNFDFGTFKGYFVENFVAQELNATLNSSKVFCWNEGQAEIEFLVQGAKGPVPIEVKSGARIRSKSLASFLERYRPDQSIILSGKCPSTVDKAGTTLISLPLYFAGEIGAAEIGATHPNPIRKLD